MILFNLFLVFLRIGLFAFGGAYSFLPLIEKEVVQKYNWLTKTEFLDIAGISAIFPGAISIKYATYTGYKVGGIPGAITANLGNALAPALLIIFAAVFYVKSKDYLVLKNALNAIRAAVFAMIIAVAFQAVNTADLIQVKNITIIILSFLAFIYADIHPAIVIIFAGIIGIIWR